MEPHSLRWSRSRQLVWLARCLDIVSCLRCDGMRSVPELNAMVAHTLAQGKSHCASATGYLGTLRASSVRSRGARHDKTLVNSWAACALQRRVPPGLVTLRNTTRFTKHRSHSCLQIEYRRATSYFPAFTNRDDDR
jgi:hypothetical protein